MSLRYWPPGYWGRADDVTAHSGLTGLAADDHPQYALLAGRAGGQTLTGGTEASNNLTLSSSSHPTKGAIFFGTSIYGQLTNKLGLGTTSPTARLHLAAGTATASSGPLKFTTGTLVTTPEPGLGEYNNTPWFTNSDAVRRSIVLSSGTYTGGAVAVGGTVQVNINGTNYNMLVQ